MPTTTNKMTFCGQSQQFCRKKSKKEKRSTTHENNTLLILELPKPKILITSIFIWHFAHFFRH